MWSVGRSSCATPFPSSRLLEAAAHPRSRLFVRATGAAAGYKEAPPADGSTRLYYSPMCPYAQRAMIAVKFKGIDLEWVEIDLSQKPSWYKDKYPPGKVPALEHNNGVIGESLDLLRYFDGNFDGPKIAPQDPSQAAKAEELIRFGDEEVVPRGYQALSDKSLNADGIKEILEPALSRLEVELEGAATKGPFFLGDFSNVDVALVPFLERLHFAFQQFRSCDMFDGYPRLDAWMKALQGLPFYAETRASRERLHQAYKRALENDYFIKIGITRTPASHDTTLSIREPVKAAEK